MRIPAVDPVCAADGMMPKLLTPPCEQPLNRIKSSAIAAGAMTLDCLPSPASKRRRSGYRKQALPFLAYTFGNGSISKNLNNEQASSPSKNDVDFLLQKELATAQYYAERLMTHLVAHNDWYPEYVQTTGFSDNVYPDMGQQYRNGWVI